MRQRPHINTLAGANEPTYKAILFAPALPVEDVNLFVIATGTLGANELSEGPISAKFSHKNSGSGRNRKFSGSFDWKTSFLVGSYRTFPPAGPDGTSK